MNQIKWLFLVILLILPWPLSAEYGCPVGYVPVARAGGQQCVVDYNLPSWGNGSTTQAPRARGKWKKTWGAIVIDTTNRLSTTIGHFTAKEAVKIAMKQCVEDGGIGCRVSVKFENQCAVVAWPNVAGGHYVTLTGASIEVITNPALKRCQDFSNGTPCRLGYSGCSDSVLIN